MDIRIALSRCFSEYISRRALARILSTFLCSVAVVVHPISRFGGSYVFLVLAIKELVFSVQEDLAQQLEATVLNVTGALFGIGISTLAKFLASRCDDSSVFARTIPSVFLVAITFIAGYLKSRLPRLQLSTRISCFVSIWILTSDPDHGSNVRSDAIDFLWITLAAALICLFSSMLLLRWSSTHFGEEVSAAFSALRACLSMSLDRAFSDSGIKETNNSELRIMHSQLLKTSIMLNAVYAEAAFELRVGRLSVKYIKPLIGTIEHLRRELSWGMSFSTANFSLLESPGRSTLSGFKVPLLDLSHAILISMRAVEQVILTSFGRAGEAELSVPVEREAVVWAAQQLLDKRDVVRNQLQSISDQVDLEQRTSENKMTLSREFFDLCLFVISLLQMAHEMRHALQVAEEVLTTYQVSSPRLWYPHLSTLWLGVTPRTFILDERSAIPVDADMPVADTSLSVPETEEGLAEVYSLSQNEYSGTATVGATSKRKVLSLRRPLSLAYYLWHHRLILHFRLRLSKIIRSIGHSGHLRHALKNAIGVALLSLPAFLPTQSAGRRWFTSVHGQWMIISYVWVLETNTGATWRVGYLRISGTILGAIYAYITWLICKTNAYGLVIFVTAADIPITWLIMYSTVSSLGVVASVTLPPIVFAVYVDPTVSTSVAKLAVLRGLMIAAGIIAALIMSHFVFPRHSRMLFLTTTSQTLSRLTQLYLTLCRNLFQNGHAYTPNDRRKTLKLEMEIRSALHRLSIFITTMDDELSLQPKPMRLYREILSTLQKILDLLTGLRKIRENIPRKETVASVFKERREFVSCICISLFACEHAFKAQHPLPQFLPSSRHALNTLTTHVDERIRQTRQEDPRAMGFSLVYAFAETEVLKDMVDTIEELLSLTRKAFGTSAWLTYMPRPGYQRQMSVQDEGPHGWHSTFK